MRKLSTWALCSLLLLWGAYFLMKNNSTVPAPTESFAEADSAFDAAEESNTILTKKKRQDLDKIGNVINVENADLDQGTRNQIKVAKKGYDNAQTLKEKQVMLEQSYSDKASTIKDIKRLQDSIVEIKNRLKLDPTNTEKWDPKFVYYLMMQENYTYAEINMIKSLQENGLNAEEINYITELIKENAFLDKIQAFKGQDRAIASIKKKPKEKDDFIDNPEEGASIESKLIEMNYNKEEKEEMVYGSTHQH